MLTVSDGGKGLSELVEAAAASAKSTKTTALIVPDFENMDPEVSRQFWELESLMTMGQTLIQLRVGFKIFSTAANM